MSITEDGPITPETAAEIIAYGREVYRKARTYRLAIQGTPEIARAMADLLDAMEIHDAADTGVQTAELISLFPACTVKAEGEDQ